MSETPLTPPSSIVWIWIPEPGRIVTSPVRPLMLVTMLLNTISKPVGS
ncbi:MAG: hypothetical protein ACOY3Y_01790 [Acidobacteriota bacterium]